MSLGIVKKVAIVNCFRAWDERVKLVCNFFEEKGFYVEIYQSNFDHMKKDYYEYTDDRYKMIKGLAYTSNLSVRRVISHIHFSKKVFQRLSVNEYEYIYILAPPNYLLKEASKNKKNTQAKIIIDIIDLWPESMPIEKFKDNVIFKCWRNLRNSYINNFDLILTECNYYLDILDGVINKKKHMSLFWASDKNPVANIRQIESNEMSDLRLVYLGSINNIIDIPFIIKIMQKVAEYRNVTLDIVGDGENRDYFLSCLDDNNLKYIYHGKIYDDDKKEEIFSRCHYALNIMKSDVKVGLTMKSIEYLRFALPLLNNIPGDTEKLVIESGIGYNINLINVDEIVKNICFTDVNMLYDKKEKAVEVYREYFHINAFNNTLNKALNKIDN